jgi:hypothetical protein
VEKFLLKENISALIMLERKRKNGKDIGPIVVRLLFKREEQELKKRAVKRA